MGLLVVIAGALMLWFGWQWERGATEAVSTVSPTTGGDIVPPVDEGADASPPSSAQSDHTTIDVIPPQEP